MNEQENADGSGDVWLDAQIKRVPPEAWPLILAAGVLLVLLVPGFVASGTWAGYSAVIVATVLVGALMPLAVLAGCRDAWHSARLILIGVAIWALIPPASSLLIQVRDWLLPGSWPESATASSVGFFRDLSVIASIVGPALIVIGLERRRVTETTWPKLLAAFALLATVGLCLLEARSLWDYYQSMAGLGSMADLSASPGLSLSDQLAIAIEALRPVGWLALGALAWSCISAFRAGEVPRRFWLSIGAGSSLVVATHLASMAYSWLASAGASSIVVDTFSLYAAVASVSSLAGSVLLLVGFWYGLPPDRLEPDESGADLAEGAARTTG